MKYKKLIVYKTEYNLLLDLLSKVSLEGAPNQACYNKLRAELKEAKVLPEHEVPDDVVRLNSIIDIVTPFGELEGYQVVLPKDADTKTKKLSILTPMGSALFGYAQGDQVLWTFPVGETTITIKKVHTNKRSEVLDER